MIKQLLTGAAMMAALVAGADAATLQVVPSAAQVNVGGTVQVAFTVANLIDLAAPSLGDYDLDVNFNAAVLGFNSVSWGDPVLGDQLDLAHLGSFAQIDSSTALTGKVNLFELSFDDVAALNNTQAGSFTLFTLTFDVLANGVSPITIGVNALGDAHGTGLSAQVTNGSVSAVPVPGALPLFASALLAAGLRRRRNS